MLNFGAEIPFVSHLGFTLHRMAGGESELHYEARPEHLNSFDVTHGGASMTLLDVTLATAARSDTPEFGVVTIEMKTSFMQPARGPLVAKGRLASTAATCRTAASGPFGQPGTQRAAPKAAPCTLIRP